MPVVMNEPQKKTSSPPRLLTFRISGKLADALRAYMNSLRPAPMQTSVLVTSLEDFLEKEGFYSRDS